MEPTNRRTFLAISGAGVAAVGVAALSPQMAGAAQSDAVTTEPEVDPVTIGDEPLLVSVEDLAAGSVAVVHGGRETTVIDHQLARKIARLARKEG